jgi:hypothetical protein
MLIEDENDEHKLSEVIEENEILSPPEFFNPRHIYSNS